jgi:F0F1-type ATP synthase membrane subunit a
MEFFQIAHASTPSHTPEGSSSAEAEHTGPHIPSLQGEVISGSSDLLGGIPVTTTILSTWIYMIFLFVGVAFFYRAARGVNMPKLKAIGIDLMSRLDVFFGELLGSSVVARRYLWLVAGFFVFIFTANIFGLILDMINIIVPSMHAYLRPINSDLNTTLIMATTVILVAQATGVIVKGFFKHYGHYVFNFSGHSIAEKLVSFFIGWLHFAGEFIRIGSLSMRLFLNIFVGVILVGVAVYIGGLLPGYGLGQFLTLPFWFFELLVAFLQAYIFMTLSGLYLKESTQKESH